MAAVSHIRSRLDMGPAPAVSLADLIRMDNNYKEMKLLAEDITCQSCAEDMEKILRDVEGIVDAAVDYFENTVSVRYDPQITDRKRVYTAVRSLGKIKKILSES